MRAKSFADQIRFERAKEKLSQSQAAETWGVNLNTLQAWENGKTEPTPFFAKCVLFWIRYRNSGLAKKGR